MWAMPSRRRTTFPTLSSPASNRRPCASLSCLTGIIAGLPLGRQLGSTSPQNPNVGNYRFFPGFVLHGGFMSICLRLALPAACLAIALAPNAHAQKTTLSDDVYMRQALAAAPEAVAKDASVIRPEHDGAWRTLREGKNGFTCLIMGTDRMCADSNSMQFFKAMMKHEPPPNKLGMTYMLGGDTGPSGETGGASNTDPSATAKTADNHWIVTDPHIMLLGPPA